MFHKKENQLLKQVKIVRQGQMKALSQNAGKAQAGWLGKN